MFILFIHRCKYMNNIYATELQTYLLQFVQIPFTTILTLSSEKPTGKSISGTAISLKQNVCLHELQ